MGIAAMLAAGVLLQRPAMSAETVRVEPQLQYQVWDGWGTSLSWWATVVGGWEAEKREQIADLLFDPEQGLGLNIVRYNIGGQDHPTHDHMRIGGNVQGYWSGEGEPYDWSADEGQRRVLADAIERGVTITEAFACSPPYWMTVSGCSAGAEEASENNLRDDRYEAFADYLTDVVRHFRDEWGVTFSTLAPMNEPAAHYWAAGKFQQGCHYDRDAQNRLLRLVAAGLQEKGLATKLSASDETATEHCVKTLRALEPDVRDAVGQINTHTYNYSYDRRGPRYLADLFGKPLYMSEICFASRAPGDEHDHQSVQGVLDIAQAITRDLREMQPQAWVLWQALTHEQYSIWWKFNYGLIHADYQSVDQTWDVMRKYHGYGQYTRFVRPGAQMIGIDAEDAVAFIDRRKKRLVIVAYNAGDAPRSREYDVSALTIADKRAEAWRTSETEEMAALPAISVQAGRLDVSEPAKSVTTYVIDGATYDGPTEPLPVRINDSAVGSGVNQFEFVGDWGYWDGQAAAFVSDNHWSPNAGDSYRVRFEGTQCRLFAAVGPNLGIAAISVDGGPETMVDHYAPERADQHLLWTSPELPPGEHVVTIRVTGEKNEASTHTHIPADRADVRGPR